MLKPFRALAWSLVKGLVRHQYPEVQSISTEKLAFWLVSEQPPPVLIDVRQEEEYVVSHLLGARHLPTVGAIQQSDISTDATLVLYCSVGYRSARLAKQLQAAGYEHVMNLEGSIFQWYNQGYPLVANQMPVQRVHHYDPLWGVLLESSE
jgi:rhodanese-related sulfurtransferase